MKHLSRTILALVLALLMATLLPVQVFADTPDYVSEIKIAMGDNAESDLEGYTILKDGDKIVDINQNAGGGIASKGEKKVLLGYKTTNKRSEAITDLALMNMKGGYSVVEYEALMETQMKTQILPFIENFQVAIDEYRENYNSKNKANKQRAGYIHDILNKLTDDDTGKPLGDLLLNETKQEMGEAYDELMDKDKKNHADLATIIAQSNGKATLLMENLLTRAADTEDDTWIERLVNLTYEDLVKQTGLIPSRAKKLVAQAYDDDANKILAMWDTFREQLLNADKAANEIENFKKADEDEINEKIEAIDENSDAEEIEEALEAVGEAQEKVIDLTNNISDVAAAALLSAYEYGEGTLYDFFTQSSDKIEEDITVLYPVAAAMSEGQLAGLDFTALREYVLICDQSKDYDDLELDKLEEASIYAGVDRAIYEKGGVALTSDSLRQEAALNEQSIDTWPFDTVTSIFLAVSAASCAGIIASIASLPIGKLIDKIRKPLFDAAQAAAVRDLPAAKTAFNAAVKNFESVQTQYAADTMEYIDYQNKLTEATLTYSKTSHNSVKMFQPCVNSTAVKCFAIGFTVIAVIFSGISVYMAYQDLKEFYKVDFTPIPHYMIDEKDLIGYNSAGEKVVLKNQSAYYKAVECNRKEGDEYYSSVGTCADMNGDVGAQWLALYAAKNEAEAPILADSFKVVVNSDKVPADYETGIHMFGSSSAFNLNNCLYDWNDDAPSVYVYFQRDKELKTAENTGANFTAGSLALTGGAGIVIGAVISALVMRSKRKNSAAKGENAAG